MEENQPQKHPRKEGAPQHKTQKAASHSAPRHKQPGAKPRSGIKRFWRVRRKKEGAQNTNLPTVQNESAQTMPSQTRAQQNHHERHKAPLGQKMIHMVSELIAKSISTFVLWALLSTAFFCTGAYFVLTYAVGGKGYPFWYDIFLGFVVFAVYGLFGLFYGVMMAAFCTVKAFSDSIGGLIREAINRVKNSIESRIDNITETISRNQVAEVIKQTFAELSRNIRAYAARTASGLIALGVLSAAIFFAKNLLIKSAEKIKNKADFFTLLSAKAALVLAVILNLSFFAKLAIYFGLLIGLVAVLSQGLIVLLVK